MLSVGDLVVPIVLAPMAGGPSTTALAAAVSDAGGLGFVAAGYLSPEAVDAALLDLAERTSRPFGLNIFCGSAAPGDPAAIEAYRVALAAWSASLDVALGQPRFDDDRFVAKIEVAIERRPAVVSFTFGCPERSVIDRLHERGIAVWITVTDADEAWTAVGADADALIAQGAEAGGHRGSFVDDDDAPLPLHDLLDALRARVPDAAVVAAGGIMTADHIRAAIHRGAAAAQLGTAFMLTPEAGTSDVSRRAVRTTTPTVLTRAFTGRLARGIANAWTEGIGREAPSAYPEVHHLTAALRAHGRATDDLDLVNLWAGTGHALAREVPAGELVRTLAAELG
jgi:nitronate monooxygenase